MNILAFLLWIVFLAIFPDTVKSDCSRLYPIEINGFCYTISTKKASFTSAIDACKQIDGRLTSIMSKELLEEIEKRIYKFVTDNLDEAKFWIGLQMKDRSLKSNKEDRKWTWEIDETQFVQKDYNLWEKKGGPKKGGLTCAAVVCSNDYKVKTFDCAEDKLPIICQMKAGKACKDDNIPYLGYGDYCFAVIQFADSYFKMTPGCEPNTAIKYVDDTQPDVIMAIKNSFMGGGVFMNMKKLDGKYVDLQTGEEPEASDWEEGEPRGEYDCVARSLQKDNTLKLKTINCAFKAAFMCVANIKSIKELTEMELLGST